MSHEYSWENEKELIEVVWTEDGWNTSKGKSGWKGRSKKKWMKL